MLEITQSTSIPAPTTGRLNANWKKVLFFFSKRAFESKLEGILNAAAGHESNSLPAGNYQYQVLNARADELCSEFADRWDLNLDLLRARIPGLAKLAGMSVPPPTRNYGRLVGLGMLAMPLVLFLLGVMAGLVSLGFHLVGGR